MRDKSDIITKKREQSDRLTIGVIGVGHGVGTTLVSTSLAFFFRENEKRVTFLEYANPGEVNGLLYNQVAMEKRFSNRKFNEFYSISALDGRLRGLQNMEMGLNWMIISNRESEDKIKLSEGQRERLLRNVFGDVVVIDIDCSSDWRKLVLDCDFVFAVIDPLPSKMITNLEVFKEVKKLEIEENNVIWIVNKFNEGVNKRQIKTYVKSSQIHWMKEFDSASIYSDEFRCKFHWQNEEIRSKMLEIFTEVSQ